LAQTSRAALAAVHAEAESEQPADYDPPPKWETLPIEMREAIIDVYLAGRLDALTEMKSQQTRGNARRRLRAQLRGN